MVDVVMRLTLVMQAGSMCPFLPHNPVNIVNQFSSETLQEICLSCHEVEATIVFRKHYESVHLFETNSLQKVDTTLCQVVPKSE